MDNSNKKIFLNHICSFLDIKEKDLSEDFSGIRPKIQGVGENHKDFIIRNESDKNLKNLIGIDFPV